MTESDKCCVSCYDLGLVFTTLTDGTGKVYACYCAKGEENRKPKFSPSDKEKLKPIYLPIYQPKKEIKDFKKAQSGDID